MILMNPHAITKILHKPVDDKSRRSQADYFRQHDTKICRGLDYINIKEQQIRHQNHTLNALKRTICVAISLHLRRKILKTIKIEEFLN